LKGFLENLFTLGHWTPDLDRLMAYHFPGSASVLQGYRVTHRNDQWSRDHLLQVYATFENGKNGDYKELGRWLHTYADSWAHEGYSAYPRFFADVGHFLAGHRPDNTGLNGESLDKAMEAADAIWRMIPDRCQSGGCNRGLNSEKMAERLREALEQNHSPEWTDDLFDQ
jgi:hypothetical protein